MARNTFEEQMYEDTQLFPFNPIFQVSVTSSQPQSENITWEIPEINDS